MGTIIRLQRKFNLPLLTFYGVGNILGAGIYVLVGKVAARRGAGGGHRIAAPFAGSHALALLRRPVGVGAR